MTTRLSDSTLSPITRAEMAHLAQRDLRRRYWLASLLLLALLASVALTGGLIMLARSWTTAVNLRETYEFFAEIVRLLNLGLLALAVADHLALLLHTLLLAAGTVSREKSGRTWDLLILTPLAARQIIVGKWWAVVSHVLLLHQRGLLLRGAALLWLGLTAGINGLMDEAVALPVALLVATLALATPVVAAGLVAAVGVLASLLSSTRRGVLVALALLLALVGMAAALDLLALVPLFTPADSGESLPVAAFLLLDGGVLLGFASLTALPGISHPFILLHSGLGLLGFVSVTATALWLGCWLAARQKALSQHSA
jgi:ABC-type transport system involved in multi-copper enzyme maturation permease subunit